MWEGARERGRGGVVGAITGVTFQLCLMPGSFGKSSSSARMAGTPEWAGASKRDHNSLKAKNWNISMSRTPPKSPSRPPSPNVTARTPHVRNLQDFDLKRHSRCYFLWKIWLSVTTIEKRVAALIKLFIHIIVLRRFPASQTKLLGNGDFCAVGPPGDLWEPQRWSSQRDHGCL